MIRNNNYYRIAKKASLKNELHPGIVYLKNLKWRKLKILDVGCGEGSRLNLISPQISGIGIDPSPNAIKLAKQQYKNHHFRVGFGEKLPYSDNTFDLVYSAFAIEHSQNPEQFITEMIRVCQPGGHIALLAPNYGSPNRRSPVSVDNPIQKIIKGYFNDIFGQTALNWLKVTPKNEYVSIDDDTTYEPYLYSLVRFIKNKSVTIETTNSLWELEAKPDKIYKSVFKYLGRLNIFPFKYWGPQLFICSKKYAI